MSEADSQKRVTHIAPLLFFLTALLVGLVAFLWPQRPEPGVTVDRTSLPAFVVSLLVLTAWVGLALWLAKLRWRLTARANAAAVVIGLVFYPVAWVLPSTELQALWIVIMPVPIAWVGAYRVRTPASL